MPDQFPEPIDQDKSVEAVPCPAVASLSANTEPESDGWVRRFRNALEASASRTLFTNPGIASVGGDDDVATGNPWPLPDEVAEKFLNPNYWSTLCDQDTVDIEEVAKFVDIMVVKINNDFRTM